MLAYTFIAVDQWWEVYKPLSAKELRYLVDKEDELFTHVGILSYCTTVSCTMTTVLQIVPLNNAGPLSLTFNHSHQSVLTVSPNRFTFLWLLHVIWLCSVQD